MYGQFSSPRVDGVDYCTCVVFYVTVLIPFVGVSKGQACVGGGGGGGGGGRQACVG